LSLFLQTDNFIDEVRLHPRLRIAIGPLKGNAAFWALLLAMVIVLNSVARPHIAQRLGTTLHDAFMKLPP
jgi:hypothetical protein